MSHNLDLGQHFMIDEALLVRIVDKAQLQPEDIVLEIGSGKGALTKHLLGKTKKIICVEKDLQLSSPSSELEFHNANVLDIIDSLTFTTVVANIPYHISEPLLIKLLDLKPQRITLVVGGTFAQKLLENTIIGMVTRNIYSVKLLETIHPSSFNPPPKTKSALITLHLKKDFGPLATFYNHTQSKLKNYFLTITEKIHTKKESKQLLEQAQLGFEDKKLYELSQQEFLSFVDVLKSL